MDDPCSRCEYAGEDVFECACGELFCSECLPAHERLCIALD